jgi:hypothetical protein
MQIEDPGLRVASRIPVPVVACDHEFVPPIEVDVGDRGDRTRSQRKDLGKSRYEGTVGMIDADFASSARTGDLER